ncbi:2-hydroxyacyl-CoA dehydratase family protein [uncultured Parolsenella sp.]|uniref:2-hydroxyacyl-CoA dehydratase family protein n=1 Tax=uncultured Parolsenella sp. TaxID=2083008 RepID=UPI0025EFF59F|nr:2-hydroxyacyl-CoA dehydratase family protein [uncultured Parolsenella sp.]
MTQVQELPRTFEEFNEQRKASFIRVKDFKQAGNRIVGYLCSYTPLEIIDAAGASSVALCGTSDEVIPEAERVLPANLCPLIKSTYGFAYSQKCPFTYFSDMIIGETTCDGKKKMFELLGELKPVHVLHLPQTARSPTRPASAPSVRAPSASSSRAARWAASSTRSAAPSRTTAAPWSAWTTARASAPAA